MAEASLAVFNTSDNTATDILIARLGLARVNTMLAALGYSETKLQTTIGQLFRRVWELLDPANRSLSDRAVYERGFPTDPDAAARRFAFEGDPREWLGCTTARETARLLEQIHNWRDCFPRLERRDAGDPAPTAVLLTAAAADRISGGDCAQDWGLVADCGT